MVTSDILVSVIIPTYARPDYLPRSIESALKHAGDSIEIIIVPNGNDLSWIETLKSWREDKRIIISPLPEANVSAARNHGLSLARGKYIRFLDDDDYLLPSAKNQLAILEECHADICSGLVMNIDENGKIHGVNTVPTMTDFISAAISVSGLRLPVGNIWRHDAIRGCLWDTTMRESEDYAWQLDLSAKQEWRWAKLDETVGVWFQHSGERGSSILRPTGKKERVIAHLLDLHQHLNATARLTANRRIEITRALWVLIHEGFPNQPIYWSSVARKTMAILPSSYPDTPAYMRGWLGSLLSFIHPLILEWALLPIRKLVRSVSEAQYLWRKRDYRRHI